MTTGALLLASARARRPEDLDGLIGPAAGPAADDVRAALVASLLTGYRQSDAPLIRALTRHETESVRKAGDGCGDVLLGCCWLLFMLGDVADSALIWEAKELNFDAYCYIDSVFLVPQGIEATAAVARTNGLADLADYVEKPWIGDPDEGAERWRNSSFFAQAPAATASVAELARWIRE